MIDNSFLRRREEQRAQELAREYRRTLSSSTVTPLHDRKEPMMDLGLWMIEQDEDSIIYLAGYNLAHFVLGSLQKCKEPGECLVIRDDTVYYAVEEDTQHIHRSLCTLANSLSQELSKPVTIRNTDCLNTYRGFLDSPYEEPTILPEPCVRRFSKSINFVGDGLQYPN